MTDDVGDADRATVPVDAFLKPACFSKRHVGIISAGGRHGRALCALATDHINDLREDAAQAIRELPGSAADTPNRVRGKKRVETLTGLREAGNHSMRLVARHCDDIDIATGYNRVALCTAITDHM